MSAFAPIPGVLACAAAIGLALAAGAAPPEYAIIELREIPSHEVYVRGLNNRGEVCGTIFTVELGLRGFIWSDGAVRILDAVDTRTRMNIDASATAINESMQVAGDSGFALNQVRATRWSGSSALDLGTLGGDISKAHAINNADHVVGWSRNDLDQSRAFIWRNGEMLDIGDLGVPASFARGINDRDQVVGHSYVDTFQFRAFLWEEGTGMINLATPEQKFVKALDINNNTQIVGYILTPSAFSNACLWEKGQIRNLHQTTPLRDFGLNSGAVAINNNGLVLGSAEGFGDFFWDESRGLRSLEDMLPPNHGWQFDTYAFTVDINDAEQIAMYGDRFGRQPGALITPVEATLTLDPPLPGTANAINTFTVRGCTPGERVTFVYGTIGGGAKVPGCALQSKAVFQMDDPITFGSTIADENGTATLTRFVPGGARNLGDVLIQAVQFNGCKVSQLVAEEFE